MGKRTETEWRELIADYGNSGQSQAAWCKARGINLYTFRDKKSRLHKIEPQKQAVSNVEEPHPVSIHTQPVEWLPITRGRVGQESLRIPSSGQESVPNPSLPDESCGTIRVMFAGFVILADTDFDEATFSRVCKALKTLC